jgi:hypothetical protein
MCHGFQMRKACRIAQANWYGHCGPDSRQKWQVVTQFQQIGNCQGKQRLAIYGPSSFPEVDHLFAPIAGESIFVEEHSKTSPFMDRPGGSRLECQLRSVKVVRAVEIRSSHLDKQWRWGLLGFPLRVGTLLRLLLLRAGLRRRRLGDRAFAVGR